MNSKEDAVKSASASLCVDMASQTIRRILVIEDDTDIGELLAIHLRDLGCAVELVADGSTGLERATAGEHDLIILDLGLPGVDGTEICQRVRMESCYTPILILTARSSDLDRIVGLEMGTDDYLTKPFNILELLARVKALFRRVDALGGEKRTATELIRTGDLRIDLNRHHVSVGDRPVQLTAKEFDLLVQFAANPGRVYTRAQLLDLVWGYSHSGYEHTVNSHINRLRSKIEENPSAPGYILTVWGVGYKFRELQGAA